MYMGELGQQGSTFVVRSQRGERPNCPAGSQVQSRHGSGIRESVTCYRPPQFAPPPVTQTTISVPTQVSVPTAVSTQVSPQISPTLAQQQASPGSQVASQPQSAPGGTSAQPSTGITGQDLERILEAQRAAAAAERDALERQRATEMETLRQQMAERERASQEIYLAEQKAAADRAEAERFAREQAELTAQESAAVYAPSGGGSLPLPSLPPSVVPSTIPSYAGGESSTQARDVSITQAPDSEIPWALIALAAAGVGAIVVIGTKKGKRKRRR